MNVAGSGPLAVIDDPTAIAGGQLIIITVEAIKERAPDRWPLKIDPVWEFTERQFFKDFPKSDAIKRLTDTNYLIAQIDVKGVAAQHKATNLLKTVITFFLGSSSPAQLNVLVVTSIEDGVYKTEALTIDQIKELEQPPAYTEPATTRRTSEALHPPISFVANVACERKLEVLAAIEPVWNVSKQAIASYYVRTTIFELLDGNHDVADRCSLSLKEVFEVDVIVIRNCHRILREALEGGYTFALHVPINFRSLRSASCRAALSRLLPSYAAVRKYVIFSVNDVPEGSPRGTIAEAVSAIKPYANAVLICTAALNDEPKRWRGTGLSGVSIDIANEVQSSENLINSLRNFAASCDMVAPGLIVHGVSTRPVFLGACAAGFTHLSGTVISDRVPETRSALRFPAAAVYS